jgi:hypothetical protein
VTGGPRSFVEVAKDFDDFPRAVRKKLLQEVATRQVPDGTRLAQTGRPQLGDDEDYTRFVHPGYPPGCDVGERRSREFWQRRFGTTPD